MGVRKIGRETSLEVRIYEDSCSLHFKYKYARHPHPTPSLNSLPLSLVLFFSFSFFFYSSPPPPPPPPFSLFSSLSAILCPLLKEGKHKKEREKSKEKAVELRSWRPSLLHANVTRKQTGHILQTSHFHDDHILILVLVPRL